MCNYIFIVYVAYVVLVIADDMGHNDIGYYNQFGDIHTPYLDKMAKFML